MQGLGQTFSGGDGRLGPSFFSAGRVARERGGYLLAPMTATTGPQGPAVRDELGALREVPFMGVIFVVHEAMKLGFTNGHPDWCNLGQGQPEVGEVAGAPPRLAQVEIRPEDHAYGPLGGTPELRGCVARHYNRLFRKGKRSQYTAANVCVASGGRLALTRAFAALGAVNVGYQLPDYTAYEDMFEPHLARLHPFPIRAREEDGFLVPPARFAEAVDESGLSALVLSNPCNPTGNVLQGKELAKLVALARDRRVTLILDEFYSHFVYTPDGKPGRGPVSGAPFVEDVERDPVLLVDGLTKSFRYPGWRVGWAVGPSAMIESLARTASAIDGGPSRIAQRAALAVLEPARADQETAALRECFAAKRNLMVERLERMGVRFAARPTSTFYAWGCLDRLPPPFDDAMTFFRRALEQKVMTVPGEFFDVNPGKRRRAESPYKRWMRFSFGPPIDNVRMGLDRLEAMLREARGGKSRPAKSRG
jgi:aspartate/methionine/tyrosine aminotransferase